MQKWPEVIRHGRYGRVLRVHGQGDGVDYLVLAADPGRRRRFARAEMAVDYLMELERRDWFGEAGAAVPAPRPRPSWLALALQRRGGG